MTNMRSAAAALAEARAKMRAPDSSGNEQAINAEIEDRFSQALARIVEVEQPKLVIEIGMACGFSALSILSTLPEGGQLISIDPFQHNGYGGIGVTLVGGTDRAASHRLIEAPDYLALPRLVEEGVTADLIYIDGMHTFDYVALDAFYAHKLLRPGGIMAFNDCGFRSVHKFLRYFKAHRDYEELDVGLKSDFRGKNLAVTLFRMVTGRSNQDRYFRKRSDWEPEHNHFVSF